MITDLWTAEDFGGSETLADYNQRLGEAMLEAMTGSSLNEKLDSSAFGDPRMAEFLAKATEKLSEIKGTPIETNSYFVSIGVPLISESFSVAFLDGLYCGLGKRFHPDEPLER